MPTSIPSGRPSKQYSKKSRRRREDTDTRFLTNLSSILAKSPAWQNFKNSRIGEHSDDVLDWYPIPAAEFSPIRKLALAVLARSIREVESPFATNASKLTVAGASAADWLQDWELVERWCRVAEIPPGKLKRRIALLTH